MNEKKICIPYKSVSYIVNCKTIELFRDYETRRIARKAVIGRLKQQLINGEHFQSPIVVNKINGHYKIIDGHHRIDAIRNFFEFSKTNREKSIELILAVYEDLTEEQEKKIYHLWSRGTPESADDILKIHENQFTIWKLLSQDDFPCNVTFYGTKKSLKFRTILNTIKTTKVSEDSFNPQRLSRNDIVEFTDSLLYEDYLRFKEFIVFFIKTFGEIEGNNIFIKKCLFIPIADIYYRNKDIFSEKQLKELFKNIISKQQIMQDVMFVGKEAMIMARKHMIEYMNVGRRKHFII